jgi:nucleotide-binding universal stress UspA family protein
MTGFTHILHPTDFSESSELACAKAVELAKQCGAKLTILHAYANPALVEGAWPIPDPGPELNEALSAVASDEPTVAIERVLRVGTAAEEIVEYARWHDCDLIVMGTHGRTGLWHLLMGSVAEKVIRFAKCPVMVISQHVNEKTEPVPAATRKSTKSVVVV